MTETDKAALRAAAGAARKARSAESLASARAAICRHVLELVSAHAWDCVAAYEPLRTEPGSTQLLATLHERGLRVLVPMTLPDRDLDWTQWTPDGAERTRLGPAAIAATGLIVVPALAVAADGTRLGRGGGSYDRALARRGRDTVTAALVFGSEVVLTLPRDPWDLPVDAAVTPDGVQRLGGNTAVAPPGWQS